MLNNKIAMAISEQDLQKFKQKEKEVERKPDVAIGICVGLYTHFGNEHHPFVVEKLGKKIGEFDTLNEALSIPGAVPFGSTPLCLSCAKLKIE